MIHTKKTAGRVKFQGFRGMDASRRRGDSETSLLLRNFRILSDGSLEKREGFAPLCTLPAAPRAAHACLEEGKRVVLFAVGAYLYRYDADTGTLTSRQYFSSSVSRITFFTLGGVLYVKEGADIRRYRAGGYLDTVDKYVPLIGRHWTPEGGSVTAPVNLLYPRVRIHYAPAGASVTEVTVNLPVWSVAGILWDDGTDTGVYGSFDESTHVITFSEPLDMSRKNLVLVLDLDPSEYSTVNFAKTYRAESFEAGEYSRAFFHDGTKLWHLAPITEEMRREEERHMGYPGELYLPVQAGENFAGGRSLRAVRRVYNRVVLFYEEQSWISPDIALDATPNILFSPLSLHLGCTAPEGAAVVGQGIPYAVNGNRIYKFDIDAKSERNCETEALCCIEDGVAPGFASGAEALCNPAENELWFAEPGAEHRVWVCDLEEDAFCVFDGVDADFFLPLWKGVGFVKDATLYAFSKDNDCDYPAAGARAIVGEFLSAFCDFGSFEDYKRLGTLRVAADLHGGELDVRVGDGAYLFETTVTGALLETAPAEYLWRTSTRRFRQAQLRLLAPGNVRQRITEAEMILGQSKKK